MDYFLDTNTLIHYKFLDEIDWVHELEDTEINLIICSTVLSELEKKKLYDADLNVRNRCKTIVSKLSQILDTEDRKIKKNVNITFVEFEPILDWAIYQLSKEISDDRILATILNSNKNAILVTHDLGLKLKAKSLGVTVKSLSKTLFVELKKDKKDEKIKQLESEILRLKSINPKLVLRFEYDKQYTNKYCFIKRKEVPYDHQRTLLQIARQRDLLKYIDPKRALYNTMLEKMAVDIYKVQDDEINRYENEVNEHLQKLEYYYKKEWEYKETMKHFFSINLLLLNEGTAPAINIDIFLHFPDGFEMYNESDMPSSPKKPIAPEKPQTVIQKMQRGLFSVNATIPSLIFPHHIQDSISQENHPSIKKTNSYDVHYQFEELKHTLPLLPLFIFYKNKEDISSFSFSYKIIANNYPEPFEDNLHIIFSSDNITNQDKVL
jgi:rRNA-processing protein FCF1